jgi:phage anti-repressor protein
MTYKSVEEYNSYLVDNQKQINIIDYAKEANKISYNIDISFIDEFIELVNKNECCIHHNMLQKYGIISSKSYTTDIKRLLNQYGMVEQHDFLPRNVAGQKSGRGGANKIDYYLHPRAFKKCLMRSLKTQQYADYYLLLEECIKYYNDYQNLLKEKYIIKLKSKIQEKDDKIDELKKMVKELRKDTKRVISKLDDTNVKLDVTNEELTETLLKK